MTETPWNELVNPYTGEQVADAPRAPKATPVPAGDVGMRNPYRNPDAPPAPAVPWTAAETPRNPYADAMREDADAASLADLGKVDAAKAARDRAAIERMVKAKKGEKPAKAPDPEAERLRLLRELHALDAGNERFANDMAIGKRAEAKADRDLATIDAGTQRMADAFRAEAARRRKAEPPPLELDPRLRAIDDGNNRFAASMGVPNTAARMRY